MVTAAADGAIAAVQADKYLENMVPTDEHHENVIEEVIKDEERKYTSA
jgi:hypothetical protein